MGENCPICLIVYQAFANRDVQTLISFPITVIYPDNPLTAKFSNLNFHPLEIVSRRRDPQLQVSENYSDLTKWRSTVFKCC